MDKHAEDVVVLDIRTLSLVADFFVVCTAGSFPQMDAILEQVEASLGQHGTTVFHTEGAARPGSSSRSSGHDSQWVLMDCGDVVVHVFDRATRDFYRLEDLWADAPRVAVHA